MTDKIPTLLAGIALLTKFSVSSFTKIFGKVCT